MMSNGIKPELNLNTKAVVRIRQCIEQSKYFCEIAFSGNMDWRAKSSYKLKIKTMEKSLAQEIRAVKLQYEKDLMEYKKEQQELEIAEKKFDDITPIESLSISSSIMEEDNEQLQFVNPISEIQI